MNLWVRLPEPLDTMGLLERARQEGVSYLPGRYFAVSSPEAGALRLSFAGLEPDQIEKGLAVLGRIFSRELAGARERELDQPAPAMV
jgi:2-aminoadipate transaminase